MKTYIKIINLVALIILACNSHAQNRQVIWVHGLNSGNQFWAPMAAIFNNERRMVSANGNYNTNRGVINFANDIITGNNGSPTTIVIGHSMGGVALRQVNRQSPNFFGGAITFGSPLDGARVVNSLFNGKVGSVIENATNLLVKGPVSEFSSGGYKIVQDYMGRHFNASDLAEIIRDQVLDNFDDLMQDPSAADLAENSTYFNSIKTFSSSVPKINVFGNENSPAMLRLASAAATNGANDRVFVELVDKAKNRYYAFYTAAVAQAVFQPFFKTKFIKRAKAWKQGYNYLNSQQEKDWSAIIGSTRTETTYYTYETYACDANGIMDNHQMERIKPNCWQTVTRAYTRTIIEPSDGLIHKSSQIGAKSSWKGTAVEALGVNHMEMGRHWESERILRQIFDGSIHPNISIPRR